MKIKTTLKAGLMPIEISEMSSSYNVKDGGISGNVASVVKAYLNHNQMVARSLKVKSGVKAGLIIVVC